MKKLLFTAIAAISLLSSCKKTGLQNDLPDAQTLQGKPFMCGMEEAMAKMPSDLRKQLKQEAAANVTGQAPELLLYLDFDGATIRPGGSGGYLGGEGISSTYISSLVGITKVIPAFSLGQEKKAAVVALVKDDFSPFNIIVTTNLDSFRNYPPSQRQIAIIGGLPSNLGMNGSGGVSPFVGQGIRLANNPSFIFSSAYGDDPAEIANTISHEAGHGLGLAHQVQISPTPENPCNYDINSPYNRGYGAGPLSFVPIMGSANKRITNWFEQECGEYYYGAAPQNDFQLINNQVVRRPDDFPNTLNVTAPLVTASVINGVLGGNDENNLPDVDFIKINFRNPAPVTITSENADMKVTVYNLGGGIVGEYNDPEDTKVTIPSAQGVFFLKIEASSNANMNRRFMTGQYTISL